MHFLFRMRQISWTLLLFFICAGLTLSAQKGYELGGWIGTSFYHGDIHSSSLVQKPGPAIGIMARRNFDKRIAVKTQFSYARVGGEDAPSDNNFERNRNLSFRSHLLDWTNIIEFNFFSYEHGHSSENMTPYMFGGFNVFRYNPTAEWEGERYNLRGLGTEGQIPGQEYGLISGGWVLGGGFKFDLNRHWSINIDMSLRFLFTDYLDDVSTEFPDKEELRGSRGDVAVALSDRSLVDGLGNPGRQRGNAKNNDRYTFVGISALRYFGGIECPEVSKIKYSQWK